VTLAAAALPALVSIAPPFIPRLEQIRLDGLVVAFALAASVLSALLFGVAPALRYTRPDMLAALRHGGFAPFVVLDAGEMPAFRERFAGQRSIDRLRPLAEFGEARVYSVD